MGAPMKAVATEMRKRLIEDIALRHVTGEQTLGVAIRRIRLEVTGLDQETFATMCKISTKTLYQIETDRANATISTVEAILRKFGLRLGLVIPPKTPLTSWSDQCESAGQVRSRGSKPRRKNAKQAGETAAPPKTESARNKSGNNEAPA
ncbi:TPA: helix-turn-helix transcriptional regulator [Pseudomonas aeruginosa]|nr:helix-turn-helix transcriptional regulator [Pseudomonas aeruginosa]